MLNIFVHSESDNDHELRADSSLFREDEPRYGFGI